MKSRYLLAAGAVLLLSGSAMARPNDQALSYLVGVSYPDAAIASARVTDRSDHTLGAVQAIAFDAKGHATKVEMALLNQDRTVTVNADHFLYDPDNNALILSRPL